MYYVTCVRYYAFVAHDLCVVSSTVCIVLLTYVMNSFGCVIEINISIDSYPYMRLYSATVDGIN